MTEQTIIEAVARADVMLRQTVRALAYLGALALIIAGGEGMQWDDVIKWAAGIAGAITGLLGEWTTPLTVLAIMMAVDYATGLIVAWRGRSPKTETGGVSSRAGFDGLIKKALIMVVVLIATLLDVAIGNATRVFQLAATMYYIANEGISILENTALMGVEYPEFIRKALETLRQKNNDGGQEKE